MSLSFHCCSLGKAFDGIKKYAKVPLKHIVIWMNEFQIDKGEVGSMLFDDMKKELIQGLTDIFPNNVSMIILYGSVARGDATADSDIDIAIVIKKEIDNQSKSRFISWAADMDIRYERVFSIMDIQEENMKKWGKVLPFYQNVQKEGIVLWRAA